MSKSHRYELFLLEEIQNCLNHKDPDLQKLAILVRRIQLSPESSFRLYEQLQRINDDSIINVDLTPEENSIFNDELISKEEDSVIE